jgi:hypothetical protein
MRRSSWLPQLSKEKPKERFMSTVTESNAKRVKLFVRLLNEGTEVSRPTEALHLGNGLFKILATENYDPDDEVWEFPPDTVVRCEILHGDSGEYLLAVKP